ncbi:dockerin type I repeat-containing protein [Ruminococcus sp. NK3A76]|uniref:dockerin type I repeat-containing protein n=1 Tax=Ruminococcus sp. NK3A76 TaxID=877411 RepID=UPI00049038E3|nr:dockerin type I repeat-containing protein [Ruminococcus sp. NK3A76]
MKKILSLLIAMALVLALGAFLPEGVLKAKALGSIEGLASDYLGKDRLYWNSYSGAAYYKVAVTSRVLNKTYKVTDPEFVFEDIFTEKGYIYTCSVTAYDSGNNALTSAKSKKVCYSANLTNMKINDDLTMTWDEFTGDYEQIHVNISINGRTGSVAGTTTGADLKPYLDNEPSGRYQIWVVAKVEYDNTLYSDYIYLDYESTALFVTSTKATITQPKEGMTPDDIKVTSLVLNDGDINASEAVKRTVLSWEDENGSALKATDKFEAGKKYTATLSVALVGRIFLDFDTGYYKYVTSSVNGIDTYVAHTYGKQNYEICAEMTIPTTLSEVQISINTPQAGDTVVNDDTDYTRITGCTEGVRVQEGLSSRTREYFSLYENGKKLASNAVFEKGHTYTARIRFRALGNYALADDLTVTIGGVKGKFVSSDTGVNENEYWVTYTADITVASDRTPGDLNGDKTVDLKDGLLISQHLAGWKVAINESNADVNGDKTVDLKDGLLLKQFLAGWKVTLK